jgi:hypothetical protein
VSDGPTIIDALTHEALWRKWLRDDPSTFAAWFAFLKVLFGLPLTKADLKIFRECTGRMTPRAGGHLEATLIIGRRGGKSLVLAICAVFLTVFKAWPGVSGERKVIIVCASTARQARSIHNYCRALITEVPALAPMLIRETATELDLEVNGGIISIVIEVADYRSVRGTSICAALLDEVAFWQAEGASPDKEVVTAVKAGMGTMPGAMLLIASSPYAKKGILWENRRRYYGRDQARHLVWQAPSRMMNPTLRQSVVDEAIEADPEAAAAEYGAQFRSDVVSYIDRAVVEDAVIADRREVAPGDMPGLINLVAHIDAAGGAGRDSFTLAIAGKDLETDKVTLLCLRETRPPFSPEAISAEYATVIRSYGLIEGQSDKFAGSWPKEQFEKCGVTLYPSRTSSQLFIDLLPLLMSGKVELLDNAALVNQLAGLERRVGRGADHIAAGGSGHDDIALACAGACVRAAKADETFIPTEIYVAADDPYDRWKPNYTGGIAMPMPAGDPWGIGRAADDRYFVGTLEWDVLRRRQGKI